MNNNSINQGRNSSPRMNPGVSFRQPMTIDVVDFDMFTKKANKAVGKMVDKIVTDATVGRVTRLTLVPTVTAGIAKVSQTYGEVYDTEPQYAIADAINKLVCGPNMWKPVERWDF